jgi:UDP:flavonoid glycosyltransferase YjiC (YdhE family)
VHEVRVLIAALSAFGHLYPLMPLATALRKSGNDVVLATGDSLVQPLRAAGWRVEEVSCDVAASRRELLEGDRSWPSRRRPSAGGWATPCSPR